MGFNVVWLHAISFKCVLNVFHIHNIQKFLILCASILCFFGY